MHDNFLEKHRYPLHIKLFGLSVLLLFFYVTPVFLWTELRQHCALKNRIDVAEQCFDNKNYYRAIQLYSDLLGDYKNFDQAKTRIIQSCFACSAERPEFYEYGLSYLHKGKYQDNEINALAYYLPTKELKSEFKSIFVKA